MEIRRSATPLNSTPAGTPVPRRRRSARPWGDASSPPAPLVALSKSCAVVEHLHEQLPRRCAVLRIALAHREVRAQRLTVVRENDREIGRDRSFFRARVALGREAPAEDRAREFSKVSHARLRVASRDDRPLVDAAGEQPLPLRILTVQDRSRLDQCGSGYHQAIRLDEAQPFEVGACVRIWRRHSRQPRGIRQRSRAARSRRCASVTSAFLAVV